jgi:thiamine-phosphate pyrophosphorylase
MTSPDVHSDICAAAQGAPLGCAIIYRHFGAADRRQTAHRLRQITFARGQQFLIGNDPELCKAAGADGVHFTRSADLRGPSLWRGRCPDWLITAAGLKGENPKGKYSKEGYLAYSGDLSVVDGLFVSSVFHSASPSAGKAIGPERFAEICRALNAPVIALGGVNAVSAPQLLSSGAAGLAGRFVF